MPVRVRLSRERGWRMPPNTVRVARARKIGWGNPFVIGQEGIPDAATAVERYRAHLLDTLQHECMRAALAELRGKNLACWCKLYQPCHADVLLELANAAAPASPAGDA